MFIYFARHSWSSSSFYCVRKIPDINIGQSRGFSNKYLQQLVQGTLIFVSCEQETTVLRILNEYTGVVKFNII